MVEKPHLFIPTHDPIRPTPKPVPNVFAERPDPHFHPSPVKKVRFADGKVIGLNRAARRRLKIYNKDLTRVKAT